MPKGLFGWFKTMIEHAQIETIKWPDYLLIICKVCARVWLTMTQLITHVSILCYECVINLLLTDGSQRPENLVFEYVRKCTGFWVPGRPKLSNLEQ